MSHGLKGLAEAPSMFRGKSGWRGISNEEALSEPDTTMKVVMEAEAADGVTNQMKLDAATSGLVWYKVKSFRRHHKNIGDSYGSRISGGKEDPSGKSNFWLVLADPSFKSSGQYTTNPGKPMFWFDMDKQTTGATKPGELSSAISEAIEKKGKGKVMNILRGSALTISGGIEVRAAGRSNDKEKISSVMKSLSETGNITGPTSQPGIVAQPISGQPIPIRVTKSTTTTENAPPVPKPITKTLTEANVAKPIGKPPLAPRKNVVVVTAPVKKPTGFSALSSISSAQEEENAPTPAPVKEEVKKPTGLSGLSSFSSVEEGGARKSRKSRRHTKKRSHKNKRTRKH